MAMNLKRRDIITISIIFILIVFVPAAYAGLVQRFFTLYITMGNRAPTVLFVNITNVTPTESGTTTVSLGFNVSDEDGHADLDDTTANISVYYNGVWRNATSCSPATSNSNFTYYSCPVTFYYYDNSSGGWMVNVSVADKSGVWTYNATKNLTVFSLSSMEVLNNLTWTSINLGDQDQASSSPLRINNTGNFDFTEVNITAYDLVGVSDPGYVIQVGNFSVNYTDDGGVGFQMVNKTPVEITGATLPHYLGGADTNANLSLFFYLDVPESGVITSQQYNSTNPWNMTVW
jgi:hypothetical protein